MKSRHSRILFATLLFTALLSYRSRDIVFTYDYDFDEERKCPSRRPRNWFLKNFQGESAFSMGFKIIFEATACLSVMNEFRRASSDVNDEFPVIDKILFSGIFHCLRGDERAIRRYIDHRNFPIFSLHCRTFHLSLSTDHVSGATKVRKRTSPHTVTYLSLAKGERDAGSIRAPRGTINSGAR